VFCSTYTSTLCDFAVRCGLFDTRAGCDANLASTDTSRYLCDPFRPSVHDGRITFDGAAAGSCLSQLQSGCSFPTACSNTVFQGVVPVDGGCFIEQDCGANAFCDSSSMQCPGKCNAATAGAGAVVRDPQTCQDGLHGNFYVDGGFFGYVCQPLSMLGGPCSNSSDCATGTLCNRETKQCETPRGPNSVCSQMDGGIPSEGFCQPLLSCAPEQAGSRAVCSSPAGTGARCFPGISGNCRFDLRCLAGADGGTCAPLAGQGVACTGNSDCLTTLYCKGTPPAATCEALEPLGARCNGIGRNCASGRCDQVPPADGGFIPEFRCVPDDGGISYSSCVDPTP